MNTQNTENTQTMTEEREPSQRRRKLLAITAGGLVLGLGGVLTLASWTDQEAAQGSFAAGSFALESSTDGTNFNATAPESPLTLNFSELAGNLSPHDSATAVYAVRLNQTSDYAASVDGAVSATGDAADNLTYQIQQVNDIKGTETIDTMISSESVTSGATHDGIFELDALDDVVYMKVTVTADSELDQGEKADVTWTLTGTSGSSLA
ncbi:SipW-dependent-type signal peptide-containing protein [Brachybacterium sacelli]|uniref:Ribosomally synthesized peptide with SipW-like signal peptide n=1 Tax=Brachybacterium sacelli TaxID=173364 RepID=A0ABS4WXB7_9MICO|nr:SipW-dependent-type signal peptide-containing protein [Brachybacterium sacelli]MBP2380833.1 putative ribosomally synthesized peptide with SipW-like signal peptide [Brachybacterium sacelli]